MNGYLEVEKETGQRRQHSKAGSSALETENLSGGLSFERTGRWRGGWWEANGKQGQESLYLALWLLRGEDNEKSKRR